MNDLNMLLSCSGTTMSDPLRNLQDFSLTQRVLSLPFRLPLSRSLLSSLSIVDGAHFPKIISRGRCIITELLHSGFGATSQNIGKKILL